MSSNPGLALSQTRNQITTVVGGGRPTFQDGAAAREAILEGPSGVAIDDAGNIYVAAFMANRVFRIDPKGRVTAVAGTGERATSGDGGPATSAAINGPSAVAVEGDTLYIAEQLGDRIRRVDESGVITTIAGNGKSPIVANGKREPLQNRVPATSTFLEQPSGLAVYGGELYFTEFAGNRVRKIDAKGRVIHVAGTGQRASNGDGGPALKAALQGPVGIVLDEDGQIYVSEVFSARVRRIDGRGKITTIAGLGKPGETSRTARRMGLRWPHGLAIDRRGNLYFSDFAASVIYRVAPDNTIRVFAGTGDGGRVRAGRGAAVENPLGLAFDEDGNLLVTLFNQGAVVRLTPRGELSHVSGEFARDPLKEVPASEAFLRGVGGVTADREGNIYVAEVFGNTILKATSNGNLRTVVGTGVSQSLADPGEGLETPVNHPVGLWPYRGGLFLAEADGHRIRFVDASGRVSTVAGTGVPGFSGDGGPGIAAACAHPHGIETFGGEVSNPAPFVTMQALAGPARRARAAKKSAAKRQERPRPFLVFVDTDNHRVRKIDEFGIITTLAGNGKPVSSGDGGPANKAGLNRPEYVAIDEDGNVFVSEAHKVRKIDTRGVITTVAGTGKRGFSGAGGPATRANLDSPYGIALDGKDLYIADSWNNVVWKVDEKGTINLFAGNGTKASAGDGGPATSASLNAPIDLAVFEQNGGVYLLIGELEGGRVRSVKIR